MSSEVYEFVKDFINKKESKMDKFNRIVEFMNTINSHVFKDAPDWVLGQCIIFGNRYDHLEIPDEGGSYYIYKDCKEYRDAVRRDECVLFPHYIHDKELFFDEENNAAASFFKFYSNMPVEKSDNKEEFLENIVKYWDEKYKDKTEIFIFCEAKILRNKIKVIQDAIRYKQYNRTAQSRTESNAEEIKLIDMAFYCMMYRYDVYYCSNYNAKIKYTMNANDPEYRSYSTQNIGSAPRMILDYGVMSNINGRDEIISCFKGIFDELSGYEFTLPEGLHRDNREFFVAGKMPVTFDEDRKKHRNPTIDDAVSVLGMDIYDFPPHIHLSGGGGVAVLFMRDGTAQAIQLDSDYCDEVWE